MTDWQHLARRMTDALAADSTLTDPAWRATFEAVPRHLFVPRFYRPDETLVDSADPAVRDEWLAAVYADESLVTKLAPVPGGDLSLSVSSATMPSLMARMLHLLDVPPGGTVLEIGTGYNAAVLCHRLGDAQVTSIDIDPDLVATARDRLAGLAYHPRLAIGDGAAGVADHAPYDRIIATCAVPAVPPAWIRQLTASGLVVADVRGEISSTLAVLRKSATDTVTGRFLAVPGHFMWLRARPDNPLRDGDATGLVIDLDNTTTRPTTLGPAQLDDPDLRFALQAHLPDAEGLFRLGRQPPTAQLRTSDGSWAEISADGTGAEATEGGPRRIWSIAERAADWWIASGRPTRDRFGITANASGSSRLWLDQPDGQSWRLPL